MQVATVAGLERFPVKSMGGEQLRSAEVTERGLVGDRAWAVYTADGGIGSGKSSRRFRKVEGLLQLCSRLDGDVPAVLFPGGEPLLADAPAAAERLSAALGQPLALRAESAVPHHDDCPVHVVTTAALRHLSRLLGEPVDVARFRANVVLDTGGTDDTDGTDGLGFVEDGWRGRELALGDEVVLRLGAGMPRCVMVGMVQDGLPADSRILKLLGRVYDVEFGLRADVVRGGTVRLGEPAHLLGG